MTWTVQDTNQHIRCTEDNKIRCTEAGVERIAILDERVPWEEPTVSTTWTVQ